MRRWNGFGGGSSALGGGSGWNGGGSRRLSLLAGLLLAGCGASSSETEARPPPPPEEHVEPLPTEVALDPRFEKITLHRDFYCEGAAFGDFDRDGTPDVVAGPDWYRGPGYGERRPIWARRVEPFDVTSYSDCFFQFTHDFDADGWSDVLVVGFPGQAAYWYENPRGAEVEWVRHAVTPVVDNESPAFMDVTGDGVPELVMMQNGMFGWAAPVADAGSPWPFEPATEPRGYGAFTHGLGAGDLDGDGRSDLLEQSGFFLQPEERGGGALWARGNQTFGSGGAQMFVEDIDEDGDADVVSTIVAHGYGLAWYEQTAPLSFTERVIVPSSEPAPSADVVIHEPHALALGDIDGDGLSDIVSGERFWGHYPGPGSDFNAPARLYWFRRSLGANGPEFTPTLIDAASGVGTQLTLGHASGDGRLDIAIANKRGAFVFRQR